VIILDLYIFCLEVCKVLEQVIIIFLELETLFNIFKIIEDNEGVLF